LKIDSVDQNLFKIQLTRVWELLTRRRNAWHWERHCVFTAFKGLNSKQKLENSYAVQVHIISMPSHKYVGSTFHPHALYNIKLYHRVV
jgi:hypothetical protein